MTPQRISEEHLFGHFVHFLTSDAVFPAGGILKLPFLGQAPDQNCFDDSVYWEVRYNLPLFSLCWKMYGTPQSCSPGVCGLHTSQLSKMLLCLRL